YTLGPLLEAMGRVVIPTAVLQVTRPPRHGEAATARVVRMFGKVLENQRLIPMDTAAALVANAPAPVDNGKAGKVRWILHEPVLPTTEQYVVLDLTARDGLATGDVVELYQPRKAPTEGRSLTLPEVRIGRAQVMRVTPYGASAMIVTQEQP